MIRPRAAVGEHDVQTFKSHSILWAFLLNWLLFSIQAIMYGKSLYAHGAPGKNKHQQQQCANKKSKITLIVMTRVRNTCPTFIHSLNRRHIICATYAACAQFVYIYIQRTERKREFRDTRCSFCLPSKNEYKNQEQISEGERRQSSRETLPYSVYRRRFVIVRLPPFHQMNK